MKNANPEMITLARDIRGVTQTALSASCGISQVKISRYEGGKAQIGQDELQAIANAMSFPVEFFLQDGVRFAGETSEIFNRKRVTTLVSDQKRIDGLMNTLRIGAHRLLEVFEHVTSDIPRFPAEQFDSISSIAYAVRSSWQMDSGPIPNLIHQLEQVPCLVFRFDFRCEKIDEAVQWIEPGLPIILVNSTAPTDRLRFSLAHALGHLVMHRELVPHENMEDEANQFAAAFLMPVEDISNDFHDVTLQSLLELKHYWKVSMQSLIMRGRDLGEISERRVSTLFQQLSRAGFRKREPFPLPPETPTLVQKMLDIYRKQLDYSDEQLAQLLAIGIDDFHEWYDPNGGRSMNKIIPFPV